MNFNYAIEKNDVFYLKEHKYFSYPEINEIEKDRTILSLPVFVKFTETFTLDTVWDENIFNTDDCGQIGIVYCLKDDIRKLFNLKRLNKDSTDKIELMMRYAQNFDDAEVPDPYYLDQDAFNLVVDYVEDAVNGLVETVSRRLVQPNAA